MACQPVGSILRERLPYLVLTSVLVGLDRWSKSLIQNTFTVAETRAVVDGFFDLVYFRNTGVAFGLFDGGESTSRAVVLSVLALIAAVVVVIYSLRTPPGNRLLQTALALILAGALGNLYDRITVGYVTDFLYFHLGSFDWPAFNVADTAITTGVGLMVLELLRHELRDRA